MSKVLVIEDNDTVRDNIVEILELAKYTVSEAANGKAGIELALKIIPDIILCDIMMAELDGYGVLYVLKKHLETSTIPFIFITAKADRMDVRRGMDMGADDYLTKPFDDLELLNAIESRLKKKDVQNAFYGSALDKLDQQLSNIESLTEFKKIIEQQKCRHYKKKQVIHHEGDKALGIYMVISGKIKTIRLAEDGRELMTGIFEADDFLDINVMLSTETYTDTATAIDDSTLCFMPKEQLDELLYQYPDLAAKFISILCQDIREKEEHLLQLAYQSVRKRIAKAIIRLFKIHHADGNCLKITRNDLAAMSGTASETVSRTLTDFKNEGLIEKTEKGIKMLDINRLINLKN
ncbi:response regulator [Flavobacterium sp. TAB 87]|uniref:response regulator n=1 Tax=Flavobacterium sp. TAB 87 TaxID=1729581 RepID=UPI00076DA3FA|nr:response regulator [Flavobacterium sp. TAB 87]KVV14804.1 Anaerobic regulatory protein [Flavobacterium sp. TAB 87]